MQHTITVNGIKMSVEDFSKAHNLTVGGYLDLSNTAITALPDNLTVGGSLYLDQYKVTLPSPGRMKIGCEDHTIDEWEAFTNKEILAMDGKRALKFWRRWKAPLIAYARAKERAGA